MNALTENRFSIPSFIFIILLSNNVASYIIYNKQDKGAIQNDWRYAKMDT